MCVSETKFGTVTVQIITIGAAILACLTGNPQPSQAFNLGACFSGGCDPVWYLNKRFDDGVRSKSAELVGPVRDAYFEIAKDLFNTRLAPMIEDIDKRAQAGWATYEI